MVRNDWLDDQQPEPLDGAYHDFDWNALSEWLDENIEEAKRNYDSLSYALAVVLRWLLGDHQSIIRGRRFKQVVAHRVVALAWILKPELFEDTPSLAVLAKRIKISKVNLSKHTARASRHFGIRNRAQRHAWNFKRKKT